MPEFSDHLVFVDESGDHGMARIDASYPVFVLAFCLVEKHAYAHRLAPAVLTFKFRHFGHDQVVLHELDIRKSRGPFAVLRDAAVRDPFMADLDRLVDEAPMTLVASAIHKERYRSEYARPANPYHVALGFGLERIYRHLGGLGCRAGTTHVVFERRGPREDAELEEEFRRVCGGANLLGVPLPFAAVMADKRCNAPGLQLADLVARPVGRHILDPRQPNRAFDVLRRKFRRSPAGRVAAGA